MSFGDWSASKIYQLSFNENLDRLNYVDELHLGVISNLSYLVRTPALALENGGFMLPLYLLYFLIAMEVFYFIGASIH